MRAIILIAHNLRSCHNVGSLLRTAEGLGVEEVILSGYTPYPASEHDIRLPHLAAKIDKQIHKTALGAEHTQKWSQSEDIAAVIRKLKADGCTVAAVEQSDASILLDAYSPPDKIALLVGREVEGVEPEVLAMMDVVMEISMYGQKESFNVVQAAAMAMYHCRFSI